MKDSQNIKIKSDEQVITDKHDFVDLFNDYFSSITAELGIINNFTCLLDSNLIEDTIYQAIHKYKYHPSIVILEDKVIINKRFDFETIDEDSLNIEISKLYITNSCPKDNIFIQIFKHYTLHLYIMTESSIYLMK